jgi:hypothetical protein
LTVFRLSATFRVALTRSDLVPEATSAGYRDFIYLDADRVRSIAAQANVPAERGAASDDRAGRERLFLDVEPSLPTLPLGPDFDFAGKWTPDAFPDGQFVRVTGVVRLLDYTWLARALGGLPAVLKKMSKIELAALKNSEEGRRMSKGAIQQKSLENQSAIARIEEFKMDELSEVVSGLYPGVVRIKVRPSADHPQHVLVASAYAEHFFDSPAALSQKYGVEVDAGWTVVGQLNVPNPSAAPPQPIRIGNQMEDAFEQMALLMNNAFRVAAAPAFPALSLTPIAIYRGAK